jgi:hypothetical protein
MEPSGRNPWQPVAMTRRRKRLKQAKTVAVGCDWLPSRSMVRRRSKRGLSRPAGARARGRCWKQRGNDPVQPGESRAFGNLLKTASVSRFSG